MRTSENTPQSIPAAVKAVVDFKRTADTQFHLDNLHDMFIGDMMRGIHDGIDKDWAEKKLHTYYCLRDFILATAQIEDSAMLYRELLMVSTPQTA